MQVCNPQEIRQAHSQYPPHSRVSLEKPLFQHDCARIWKHKDSNFENPKEVDVIYECPLTADSESIAWKGDKTKLVHL